MSLPTLSGGRACFRQGRPSRSPLPRPGLDHRRNWLGYERLDPAFLRSSWKGWSLAGEPRGAPALRCSHRPGQGLKELSTPQRELVVTSQPAGLVPAVASRTGLSPVGRENPDSPIRQPRSPTIHPGLIRPQPRPLRQRARRRGTGRSTPRRTCANQRGHVNFGVADLQARKHVSKPGAAHARAHYDKLSGSHLSPAGHGRRDIAVRFATAFTLVNSAWGDDYAEARASAACVTGSVGRSKHPV